jgi:hypothetical protein
MSIRNKNWSRVPDEDLTLGQTGRLTVGRNVTSTSTSNMQTKMYALLDKVKPHIEILRGLNLAAVTCGTAMAA